jgi:ATP-binding cassette subfamily F protein 3
MVSRGGVAPFDGDLDDYQRYLLDEAKRQREAIKEAQNQLNKQQAKASAKPAAVSPDERRKWTTEIARIDARIATVSAEGAALEGKLSLGPLPHEIAELGKRLKRVNDELKKLEDDWLAATEALESVSA